MIYLGISEIMNMVSEGGLNPPGLPPPPGVTSNYINPAQDRATQYNAVCYFTLGLASLFLFARLYTRVVLQKSPGWDDCEWVLFKTLRRTDSITVSCVVALVYASL